MREPVEIAPLTTEEVEAVDTLYRSTKDVRVRTRAHIILLAGAQGMQAPTIAKIVRTDDQTGRNWGVSLDGGRDGGTEGSTDARKTSQGHCGLQRADPHGGEASAPRSGTSILDVDLSTAGRLYGRANGTSSVL